MKILIVEAANGILHVSTQNAIRPSFAPNTTHLERTRSKALQWLASVQALEKIKQELATEHSDCSCQNITDIFGLTLNKANENLTAAKERYRNAFDSQ